MTKELESLVDEINRQLIRNHRFDTSLFDELTQMQLRSGITHGDRPISPFLRPYFLGASRYRAVRLAARILSGAFDTLTESALEYPEVMEILGMSETEQRFARLEPGYRSVSVTSRFDTFLNGSDFKFLEYNAETPAGVGDQSVLASLYDHVPTVREFLSAHTHFYPQPEVRLLDVLLKAYREFGGRKPMPNIAIVDWAGVDTSAEFEILRQFFGSRGFPAVICDPGELEYDGQVLRHGGFEIDIFYKRVIIRELLERSDVLQPISEAVADGAVCMANSFRSKIPHKKASFAVLSDERFHRLFNGEQLDAISEHIPWTRKLSEGQTTYTAQTIDLVEFIRSERHRLVLKPNDDYGGKGIVFGWESTEGQWDEAIEAGLGADYIVQERAEVEKTEIPVFHDGEARIESLTVDFDPYLFMGEVEGGMVRLASGSLVNITQGGCETAFAVLEEF